MICTADKEDGVILAWDITVYALSLLIQNTLDRQAGSGCQRLTSAEFKRYDLHAQCCPSRMRKLPVPARSIASTCTYVVCCRVQALHR